MAFLVLGLALSGCDGCGDAAPAPPAAPVAVTLSCGEPVAVGDTLGNAAAVPGGLIASSPRGVVQAIHEGAVTPLDLKAKSLGGVYHLGDGQVFVLEFGGDRVFELAWADGKLTRKRTFEVGQAPRLLVAGDGVLRVVSRDPERPLTEIDLSTGSTRPVNAQGEVAADLVWHDKSWHTAWLREGKVGDVEVAPEPYLLHSAASGLYALHAGKQTLTRVGDAKTLELTGSPSRMSGDLVVLLAGSGALQVVEDMAVVRTHPVPVGAADVVVFDGVAAVAGGASGQLTVIGLREGRPVRGGEVNVPFAAGRLYAGDEVLWVVGPQSGQAVSCTLKPAP